MVWVMRVGRKPVTFQNVTGIAAGLIKNLRVCRVGSRQCRSSRRPSSGLVEEWRSFTDA